MVKQMKDAKAPWKANVMKEEAIKQVVKMYQDGLDGPESSRLGFWAVSSAVEKAMKGESGVEIKISYGAVRAQFNGAHGHSGSRAIN